MLAGGYAGKLAPAASDYVSAILEAVDRLSKLIDDVLALTQGDPSGIALERERVDLAGLCRTALDTVQPRASEKNQQLQVDIDPSTGFAFADVRRLRESIEHVLNNAIAYTDKKGRIRLEAAGDETRAIIRISDNGIGISKQDLPRVFERFGRINEAGVRGEAALGLGLPLTRQFLEAHGGTVELESKKGKGTTVTLTIPRGTK
jgi:signal transduction histidine kinase